MKKVMLCLAAVVVTACLFSGCSKADSTSPHTDASQVIRVKTGEEFTVALKANPTTGYDWEYTDAYEWIQPLGKTYEADTPVLTGSGGTDLFRFKAHGAGSATLNFVYKRSWETAVAEQKTFTIEVS
jgi:inhibitor of cysteine peptidase